jgi:hypothetical protein
MPDARISPKVIFIGRVVAGIGYDSADRASREARYGLGTSPRGHLSIETSRLFVCPCAIRHGSADATDRLCLS